MAAAELVNMAGLRTCIHPAADRSSGVPSVRREAAGGIGTTLPINIVPSSNLGAFMDFADCLITLADRAKTSGPNR